MPRAMHSLLVFLVAAVLSLILTPLTGAAGRRIGIVDRPGGRRRHTGTVSRLGGAGMVLAFGLAVGFAEWRGWLRQGYGASDLTRLVGLIVGGGCALLLGLADDRFDLSPLVQFAFQFILSMIALTTLLWLERFTLPVLGYVELSAYSWGPWLYVPLTVLWMMGMMNTVNWLDGLDGLASGVGAILCVVLAIHMERVGQPSIALLPLALLGALVGFLPYNIAPAHVFLGSAGALSLGYLIGGLGLIAGGRVATVLLVMGLPIVDVAWTIFDRLRRQRSPVRADRAHLHFRLFDMGLSQRVVVVIYWGFCALFGVLALTVSSRLYKLLALTLIGVGVALVLAWLSQEAEGASQDGEHQ